MKTNSFMLLIVLALSTVQACDWLNKPLVSERRIDVKSISNRCRNYQIVVAHACTNQKLVDCLLSPSKHVFHVCRVYFFE